MNKKITLWTILVISSWQVVAQDQHFTQFYAAPLTLNPALTGTFEGKYRFAAIYRDQWRSVLENPYITFGGAVDLRFERASRRKKSYDAIGAGVQFFNDRVPSVDFTTNQIMLSGAYHKALDKGKSQFLTVGVQFGIMQRNINYEKLSFNDQFNGTDGYTDPTREALPENNFSFGDISAGLHYSFAPKKRIGVFLGGAIHHITEPQTSFFVNRGEDENAEFVGDSKLFRKYTLHAGFLIPIGEKVQITPRGLAYMQGPHLAANAGSNIRFLVNDVSGTALHIGGWARSVKNEDSQFSMDALVMMMGIEVNNFLIGFSYDANLNVLNNLNKRQGAFEVSIAFLGQYESDTVLCPKF